MSEEPPPEEDYEQIVKLPLDVTVMDLRSLLQMLRSPEEHIKEYAVRSLLLYAQQDAKCFAAVVKLGLGCAEGQVVLPRKEGHPEELTDEEELWWRVDTYGVVAFFCYFTEERNKLQIAALDILAYLTRDQGVRDNVRILNALPYVADALAPTTEDLLLRAPSVEIVKNFAGELTPAALTQLRECVSCEGAANVVIPGLVDLMINQPSLEEVSMQALGLMCRDTESRFRVRELQGIKHLVLALSRPSVVQTDPTAPAIQAAAIEVLVHAADDPTNKKELMRFRGVSRLLELMELPLLQVAVSASIVLDKMMMEVENRSDVREDASKQILAGIENGHGGVLRLLHLLGGKVLPEVLRPGLSALAYCSFDHISAELISEYDGVAIVTKLLASGGGGKVTYGRPAKASAAMVLSNMARNPSLRLVVIRGAGVAAAIRALNDKEPPTQQEAAVALHWLALDVSGTAVAQMKKAGIQKRLVELLSAGDEGAAYGAALAIESYARADDETRELLLAEGAPKGLVALLSSKYSPKTCVAAAGACEWLAINQEVRDSLDHEGCTEMLAKMLDTDHLQMLFGAIAACKTMAVDEPIANNLCLHGGYTLLTKLEEKSPYPRIRTGASEVVEQLLKINLAMKFYLQGKLLADVKIKDGFFVQFGGSGFRTAEELRKEPQDDQNIECLTLDSVRDSEYAELCSETEKAMAACKDSFQQQVKVLAKLVSDRHGGAVNIRTVATLGYTSQIARIKAELSSHAVPIGRLKRGALRHRAFLFKALADTFDVPCSLERSADGWRMWNCVNVKGEAKLVDLMMRPGEVYSMQSPEAQEALNIEVMQDPASNEQHGSLKAALKRNATILDENLFPHTAINYQSCKPHFTQHSNLTSKAVGVQEVSGNAQLAFHPSGSSSKPPSLGGRSSKEVAFDYEAKRAEVVEVLQAAAAEDTERTGQAALLKAIYDWIAANIRYAYGRGAGRHTGGDKEVQGVLQRRRGTSEGFSVLLAALCEACGMEAKVVKGHCKVYDMFRGVYSKPLKTYLGDEAPPAEPEEPPPEPEPTLAMEHAWNVIVVDGQEMLVDSCAAVYLASESGEVQGFCGCSPEKFVLDHLPEEESMQLLEQPVDRETFIKTLHLRPGAEELEARLVSHPGAQARPMVGTRFSSVKPFLIVLRCPDDVIITAKLMEFGKQLPESLALVHRRGQESLIDVACPTYGTYTLRLFAQRRGEDKLPTWICDYTLDIDVVDKMGRVGFSECLPPALGRQIYVRHPQQMNLESNNAHVFEVEVPGASAIALGSSKVWLQLDPTSGEANCPWRLEGRFRQVVYIPHGGDFFLHVKIGDGPYEPWMRFLAM